MAYFSNLLTATKNRYAHLRAGDDADGDSEDDSHITRALRNYYLENPNRPYPEWLPPPPNQRSNSPAPAPVTSLRNTYGRRQQAPSQQQPPPSASLSDIWDAPTDQHQQQYQQQQQQHGRPSLGRSAATANAAHPRPQLFPDEGSASAGGAASMTAQQRIKERLWGSRGTNASPPPPQQPQQHSQYPPPHPASAPAGSVSMPTTPQLHGSSSGGGQPYVGAGMPWSDGYGTGFDDPTPSARRGVGGGGAGPGGRVVLPTGPRDGRPPYR